MAKSEYRTRDNGKHQMLGVFTHSRSPDTVDIHTYGTGQRQDRFHIFDLPIEEFLNAVRSIPGVEVTYTPPKPKYFPKVGTAIRSQPGTVYLRLGKDRWVTSGPGRERYFTDAQMFYQDDPLKYFTEL